MTKEEILDKSITYAFECDDASMVIPYGAAENAMDEYAKQQTIAFIKDSIQKQILHPTTDETICIDGIEVDDRRFDLSVSHFYGKFIETQSIEQQNKPR